MTDALVRRATRCCRRVWRGTVAPRRTSSGRFTSVTPNATAAGTTESPDTAGLRNAKRLRGVVLPGFANAHSHAFHRALRGRTYAGGGTFWTWREAMYSLASRLDPDNYLALARATYAEMALASASRTVGEFHYLHHATDGTPYDDPNAMGHALQQAASEAGIRLTLLDTCYLEGGLDASGHLPLDEVQLRFSDKTVEQWESRVSRHGGQADGNGRSARPSTRSAQCRSRVTSRPGRRRQREAAPCTSTSPSSRPRTKPDAGVLRPHSDRAARRAERRARAAHDRRAPRPTSPHRDIQAARFHARVTIACFCPTTERDLGDGIGPGRALADARAPG